MEKRNKQERASLFGWALRGCGLLVLLFLSGCSLSRQATGSLRVSRTDSLSLLCSDSLLYARLRHLSGHTRLEWNRVLLSAPDSAGRQYPLSLTSARLEREEEETRQDSVYHLARRKITDTRREQKEEKEERSFRTSAPASPFPTMATGLGLLLFCLAVWGLYRHKMKKNK